MSFRFWTIIAVGLFVIGIALGLTVHGSSADIVMRDMDTLKQFSAMLRPFQLSTALFIWGKNVTTLLISFVLSPLLGLMPILALTLNGWLLSLVGALAVEQRGLAFVLAAILPHGIIEIPALIIGEAAALSSGATAVMAMLSEEKRRRLGPSLKQNLKYLGLAIILLVPAAVIETYVTPLFLR